MTTKATREAIARYHAKLDEIRIHQPKGTKDFWKAEAARRGLSLARFVSDAVAEKIAREQDQPIQPPEE